MLGSITEPLKKIFAADIDLLTEKPSPARDVWADDAWLQPTDAKHRAAALDSASIAAEALRPHDRLSRCTSMDHPPHARRGDKAPSRA